METGRKCKIVESSLCESVIRSPGHRQCSSFCVPTMERLWMWYTYMWNMLFVLSCEHFIHKQLTHHRITFICCSSFFREDPEEEKHRGKKHRTQHNWKWLRYTHIDSLRLVLAYFSFFLASIRMEFSIIYAEASFLSTDSVVQQFTTLRCFSFSSDMHIVVVVGASCWLCVVRLCVRFYYYYISHLFPAFYPVIVEWVPVVWLCPLCRR